MTKIIIHVFFSFLQRIIKEVTSSETANGDPLILNDFANDDDELNSFLEYRSKTDHFGLKPFLIHSSEGDMPNKSDRGNVEFRSYCYSEQDGYVFDDTEYMQLTDLPNYADNFEDDHDDFFKTLNTCESDTQKPLYPGATIALGTSMLCCCRSGCVIKLLQQQ